MSRFARIRRRPDHWPSPHARARARAAERLDGPLGLAEATWLEEHLAGCADCAAIAAAYDADRASLRMLRDAPPEPPRDLWARTAAGIEAAAGGRPRHAGADTRHASRVPIGALSGIAVIAVVVGLSAVSSGLFNGPDETATLSGVASSAPDAGSGPTDVTAGGAPSGGAEYGAVPTPLAVGAGNVAWIRTGPDGDLAFNAAEVREVCRADSDAECATLDDLTDERLALTATPKSIISSPTDGQAIVVSDDGAGGERITVVALPVDRVEGTDPTPSPPASPSTTPSTTPPASDEPTATPDGDSVDPSPSGSPEPSASPSEPVVTDVPPTDAPTLSPTPEPTVAGALAIASDIQVVGESAAFSPDGAWFAFTARPLDGSTGPDVYVWEVGAESARRLTDDGRTYFASWDGDTVVASRPAADAGSRAASPTAVSIDPVSGVEQPAGDLWNPVVDPTGRRAVAWAGTVSSDAAGAEARPVDGRLELRAWDRGAPTDDAVQVVGITAAADFDVRWDETGEWFAIWVADPSSETLGRLSLYRVDPSTGLLERPDGAPVEVPSLSGFSIGQGRLAWATPPGQGGEGSRVQVVAWAADGVGSVETAPGEDVIVVR